MPARRARRYRKVRVTPDLLAALAAVRDLGPVPGADAAAHLGWSTARWWATADRADVWVVTGRGYVLTAAGRRLLREHTH